MRTSTTTSAIADSVGALLKQAREESGLSRNAVAMRSKIPERYIALFEDDTTGAMQDDVYVKIYLKAYGKFLGFEANTLLDLYKKEKARFAPAPEPSPAKRTRAVSGSSGRSGSVRKHPTKSVPDSALYVAPKLIQNALLGLALVGLGAYFGLQIKKLVAPPEVALVSPADGLVTEERSLLVEGRTEAEVTVRINGKQVSPDADGRFKDTLDLQEGLNLITVTGSKKHSKNMTVTRRIIVMPKERNAAVMPTEAQETDIVDGAATGTVAGTSDTAPTAEAPQAAAPAPKPVTQPAPQAEPQAAEPSASAAPTETAPAETAPVTEPTPAPAAEMAPAMEQSSETFTPAEETETSPWQ